MNAEPLRIALTSECASPLAAADGVDERGRHTAVAPVAQALALVGDMVGVATRPQVGRRCPTT